MYLENSYFSENKTLSTKISLVKGKKTMNEWTNKTAKLSHWMRNTNKPTTYECHGFLVLVDSWRVVALNSCIEENGHKLMTSALKMLEKGSKSILTYTSKWMSNRSL